MHNGFQVKSRWRDWVPEVGGKENRQQEVRFREGQVLRRSRISPLIGSTSLQGLPMIWRIWDTHEVQAVSWLLERTQALWISHPGCARDFGRIWSFHFWVAGGRVRRGSGATWVPRLFWGGQLRGELQSHIPRGLARKTKTWQPGGECLRGAEGKLYPETTVGAEDSKTMELLSSHLPDLKPQPMLSFCYGWLLLSQEISKICVLKTQGKRSRAKSYTLQKGKEGRERQIYLNWARVCAPEDCEWGIIPGHLNSH